MAIYTKVTGERWGRDGRWGCGEEAERGKGVSTSSNIKFLEGQTYQTWQYYEKLNILCCSRPGVKEGDRRIRGKDKVKEWGTKEVRK